MAEKNMPALPKHLMIVDASDDEYFGALTEHAWDSDYNLKVNDPMFCADQMHAYAQQYAEQRVREEREACLAEIETGIWFDKTTEEILDLIAAAIRQRSNP